MDIFNAKGKLDLSNCTTAEVERLSPEKREAFYKLATAYDTNFANEAALNTIYAEIESAIQSVRAERVAAEKIHPKVTAIQNVRDFIASEAATAAARRG